MLQHRDVSLQPPCLKWDHPVLLEGYLGLQRKVWHMGQLYCISFLLVAQDEKRPTELSKTDPAP